MLNSHRTTGAAPEGWPAGRTLPKGLSASSLETFRSCERRFAYEKIEGLPSPPNTAAAAGTFVHQVLQYVMQLPPEQRELDVAMSHYDSILRHVDTHAALLEKSGGQHEDVYSSIEDDGVRRLLRDYYESGAERDVFVEKSLAGLRGYFTMENVDPKKVDVVCCEERVEAVVMTPSGEVPLRGEIDRVDRIPNGIRIVDYKNGKFPKPFREDDGQQKFRNQIAIYALLWEAATGERPNAGGLVFTSEKQILKVPIDDALLDGVRELLGKVWRDIQQKLQGFDYEPMTGPLCGWCPFVDRCPEGEEEVRWRAGKGTDKGGLRADAPARGLLGLAI